MWVFLTNLSLESRPPPRPAERRDEVRRPLAMRLRRIVGRRDVVRRPERAVNMLLDVAAPHP